MKDVLPYIIIFLMFLWVMNTSKKSNVNYKNKNVTETVDTIKPDNKTIKLDVNIPKSNNFDYEIIKEYVDGTLIVKEENDLLKEHIEFLKKHIDSLNSSLNVYKDSFEDNNIIIYSSDLVDGKLLSKSLDYKLKVPTTIIKTKTITETKNKLFLTTRVGGNKNQFDFTAGLMFINKKDRLIGYEYNVIDNTHQLKLGLKLF